MNWPVPPEDRKHTRAVTDDQKRQMIDRILTAWMKRPDQRFGQFLQNAMGYADLDVSTDFFYIEDGELTRITENYLRHDRRLLHFRRP